MITALHSNGVRMVLVERLDRMARDLMIQEATIADLQRDGFTLASVQEPDLMASYPSRIAFRQMITASGAFAIAHAFPFCACSRTSLRDSLSHPAEK